MSTEGKTYFNTLDINAVILYLLNTNLNNRFQRIFNQGYLVYIYKKQAQKLQLGVLDYKIPATQLNKTSF